MHSAVPKKKSSNRGGGPLLRRTLSEQQAEAASADASAGDTGDAGRACFTHFAPGKCRVLKFGGSSVGSGERLRGVVQVRMRGDTRRETERGRWEMGERERDGERELEAGAGTALYVLLSWHDSTVSTVSTHGMSF